MSLLSNFSDRKFKDLVNYRSKIGAEGESKPGSAPLKTFSTWLDEYALANVEPLDYLEMPGQYGGDERPTMSSIVKISSFSPNVLVMSSMRRPKRLVAVGTDEVEYPWLVKGGEDLRLDQRIQQIFGIMNRLMLSNAYCRRHTMQLHTYKVVPMTSTLGLIEWVNSTKPLKSCMADMPDFDREFKDSQKVFGEFIKTFGKSNQSIIQCYDQYLSAPRASVVPKMQELWRVVKGNYLRDFIMIMAATPEAFVTLRSRFATSLAALNVCSYLLGIGDRHLDNFLVNLKTGGIIGIDFGHAFGSATEVLPVPELVPFRLTKQMERLLLPLGVPVLMLDPMVNTMRGKN
ncbi:kinase-like domain-containing protein [Zopfochytrium polystomum]|nr:kinase-like domain-containing protein [Zopfochytrium polystomum]